MGAMNKPDNRGKGLQAVILAGGKGTRLKPYTAEIPKPLVTVGEKPIIEILLSRMKRHGVERVHIAVNHQAHLIMAVLDDGSKYGLDVRYSHEPTPLSTVGPLKLIDPLDENFLVCNGDVLTDLDLRELYDYHVRCGGPLTVAVHQRVNRVDYGVLEVSADGLVTGFKEKPTYDLTVSMGVYVFSRSVLEHVPEGRFFGFDDLMLTLLERGERVNAFVFDGYWMDIGRPEDYEQANLDVQRMPGLIE
jgi:NDP-sugar pyrophosphorylase family protein